MVRILGFSPSKKSLLSIVPLGLIHSGRTEYSRLLQQALFVPSIPVKIMLEDLLLIYHYKS